MTTTVEINIDQYLSEDDKREIAASCFRESLTKGLLQKTDHKQNYDNYERVISNSVYHFLEQEIDSILGADHKEMIRAKVQDTIGKVDYQYSLFRSKSAWEKNDSPAQKIANEAVEEIREEMTQKIHDRLRETIESIQDDKLYELFQEAFADFIYERFKK